MYIFYDHQYFFLFFLFYQFIFSPGVSGYEYLYYNCMFCIQKKETKSSLLHVSEKPPTKHFISSCHTSMERLQLVENYRRNQWLVFHSNFESKQTRRCVTSYFTLFENKNDLIISMLLDSYMVMVTSLESWQTAGSFLWKQFSWKPMISALFWKVKVA